MKMMAETSNYWRDSSLCRVVVLEEHSIYILEIGAPGFSQKALSPSGRTRLSSFSPTVLSGMRDSDCSFDPRTVRACPIKAYALD